MKPLHVVKQLYYFVQKLFNAELTYYASSLSFYTIFTITPLLLIILSLLPSLPHFKEYFETLKSFIFSTIMPIHSEALSEYINTFLLNSDKIGSFGAIMLLVSSFLFFENYEYIVAKIFMTNKRSFFRSLSTFWTLLTLTPIGLIAFFYISAKIDTYLHLNALLPFTIIWLLFFLIYIVSPNTKVSNLAALKSSFLSALVWNIAKTGFVYYAFYSKTYETMYGSFSILIFFFLWIYLSWIIFLYGLKVCHMLDEEEKNDDA